jgi:hypothetical protein
MGKEANCCQVGQVEGGAGSFEAKAQGYSYRIDPSLAHPDLSQLVNSFVAPTSLLLPSFCHPITPFHNEQLMSPQVSEYTKEYAAFFCHSAIQNDM